MGKQFQKFCACTAFLALCGGFTTAAAADSAGEVYEIESGDGDGQPVRQEESGCSCQHAGHDTGTAASEQEPSICRRRWRFWMGWCITRWDLAVRRCLP